MKHQREILTTDSESPAIALVPWQELGTQSLPTALNSVIGVAVTWQELEPVIEPYAQAYHFLETMSGCLVLPEAAYINHYEIQECSTHPSVERSQKQDSLESCFSLSEMWQIPY